MGKIAHILRDRRRSKKYIHVGKVTVYPRAASWHIYFRENGTPRRMARTNAVFLLNVVSRR